MKNAYQYITVLLFFILSAFAGNAQSTNYEILESEYNNKGELFYFKPHSSWNKTGIKELPSILTSIYGIQGEYQFRVTEQTEDEIGTTYKLKQTYHNIDILGGEFIVQYGKTGVLRHVIGTMRSINGKGFKPSFDSTKAIELTYKASKTSRIHLDINPDDGKPYEPVVKLMYSPMNGDVLAEYVLTYEVELVLIYPDRYLYYINAETGEVANYYSAGTTVHGTGNSLYSGTVGFTSNQIGSTYYLSDTIRNIRSYDHLLNRFWIDVNNTGNVRNDNFPDLNNNWGTGGQKAAADVHWGMTKVYDYYSKIHSRNSYDNAGAPIINRVHCDKVAFTDVMYPLDSITGMDSMWNNAEWNGRNMSFGDGDGALLSPMVVLDISGHEFTHAVVQKTAGLVYQGESGALNEAFADIFGTCIEHYAAASVSKTANFLILEECYTPGIPGDNARDMSNPKNSGHSAQPDTYGAGMTNWASTAIGAPDNGGVHINSGVANYWFYLLCSGASNKTNDKGNKYSVTAIGIKKAEKIAYKALTTYMSPMSDFASARKATLLATEDLYGGKKSNEYKQVCNAWYAVNVGSKCCADSIELDFKVKDTKCHDTKDGEIELTVKKSTGPFEYKWYKNDTNSAVLSTNKDITGLDTGKYYVIVKDTSAKCEVVDKTKVKSPKKIEVSVAGGGATSFRVCDPTPKVTLVTSASGGTLPYTYNWPNNGVLVVSSSGKYTAVVRDKNNCKGDASALVTFIPILCSKDPNDIVGPKNYGPKKYVSKFATQQYKIRFENDPKFATAPASKVTIDLPLDNNMDMNTFRVSSFGFNNWTFNVPNDLTTYYERLDLTDSLGIYLDVTAGVDQSSQKAFWILESIDPATGLPPTLGTIGFLPVNDSLLHNGEGFVDFTVRAKTSTITGDSLRARADIVFDDNDAILTPRIHNIIDAKPPVSKMDSMPAIMDSTSFVLRFRAKDDIGGSGYSNADLMVSENNGPFSAYQKNIADTFILFSGNSGSYYQFYTQGYDNVGNKEDAKPAEVKLTITPRNFLIPVDSTASFCVADTFNLRWKKVPITTFDLQYAADTGGFNTFATGLSGADTLYKWKLPSISNSSIKIRIRAVATGGGLELDRTSRFTVNPSPVTQLANDTFYCDGASISLLLDAGAGFTSYFWTDSSSAQTLSVGQSGKYGVTVTNSYGCTAYDETNVSKALRPVLASKTITSIACYGYSNGAISLVTVSGTAPYQFLWNTSDTVEDLTGIPSGTYQLLITDSKGCFIRDTTDISEPPPLDIAGAFSNVKCKSGNDGSINISVNGGTGSYSYLWNTSATTEDLSNVIAGTYKVLVKDANNCEARDSFIITEPALLTSSKTKTDVKCKNGNDGSIDLVVNGGTSPYTYLWSNSATTQDLNGLTAGIYTVVITDTNACIRKDTVVITEPTLLLSSKTSVNVKCKNGNDGSIDLSVSGGTSPYTYVWSNSATTQDLSGLIAGTYSVIITDANACTRKDTIIITEPILLTKSKTFIDVKCKNGNDGSIDLSVNGGTTPYVYLWSNSATTQDLTSITAGTYSVRVTDANNCIVRDTTVITEPTLLVGSKTKVDVKCKNGNDGSIDLTISGGVTPYAYLWSNSATTQDIATLTAGTYTVRTTDANACIRRDTVIITEPALLATTKNISNVKCKNGNDGNIDITVTGGITPYAYLWNNSATTQDISNLIAGTYNVRITDANGCTRRDTFTVTEPALLTKSKTFVNVKCKNGNSGSIDLSVSGGTTPYTYLLSYSATTQDISSLTVGTYIVVITDANACTRRDTTVITEPPLLVSSKTKVDVKCKNGNDGSIDLSVSGGTTPYTYLWSNSATTQDISSLTVGTYTVVITDANACIRRDTAIITEPTLLSSSKTSVNVKCKNGTDGTIDLSVSGGTSPYTYLWNNTATTQDLSGLSAGTYSVIITDANACTRKDTVIITEPTLLTKFKTSVNVKCKDGNDGSIDLTVIGGTGPYNYLWSNSATTQDIITLVAGTYSVIVTDAQACTVKDTTIVTEPAKLISNKTFATVKCKNGNDGSIDLTVSGGVTPYAYLWSNNAATQDITTLKAGTYSVRVTDANSCITRDTTVITEPGLLLSTITVNDVLCHAGSDGSITSSGTGGVAPYTYLWNTGESTATISNKTKGQYIVLTTDQNLCFRRDTMTINEPLAPLSITNAIANVNCFAGTDGSIDLTTAGGTTPYNFLWNNAKTTEDISGEKAGTYSILITDKNNCTRRDTFTITEPAAPISYTKFILDVKCFAGADGAINLTPTGGTQPYNFVWNNAATTEDISGLVKGKYTFKITDKNNCTLTDSMDVKQPSAPLSSLLAESKVNCFGGNDGAITATINGGTVPYTYKWSNGALTKNLSNVMQGKYNLLVTDSNNCTLADSITVTEPTAPLKAVLTADDVDCHGDNTGAVSLVPSGGTPAYTFNWSNGASTQNIGNLTKGIYKVTIKDANSCSYSDSAIVPEPTELNIQAFASTATNSDKNGFAWSKINGGTPPYSIQWNDMTSQTTDTATNLSTGEYIVTVIDAKGCTKADTVDLKKAPDPSTIALFPNPNRGLVTIVNLSSLGLDETIFIDVIDMAGKICTTYEVKGKDSAIFEMIDSFRNSTYIIKIHNSRGIQNRRLILIR